MGARVNSGVDDGVACGAGDVESGTVDAATAIYMGDGIFDSYVFPAVGYGIAPSNAFHTTRVRADYVTTATGGDRAVAEACLHILEKFFTAFDPDKAPTEFAGSGEWTL